MRLRPTPGILPPLPLPLPLPVPAMVPAMVLARLRLRLRLRLWLPLGEGGGTRERGDARPTPPSTAADRPVIDGNVNNELPFGSSDSADADADGAASAAVARRPTLRSLLFDAICAGLNVEGRFCPRGPPIRCCMAAELVEEEGGWEEEEVRARCTLLLLLLAPTPMLAAATLRLPEYDAVVKNGDGSAVSAVTVAASLEPRCSAAAVPSISTPSAACARECGLLRACPRLCACPCACPCARDPTCNGECGPLPSPPPPPPATPCAGHPSPRCTTTLGVLVAVVPTAPSANPPALLPLLAARLRRVLLPGRARLDDAPPPRLDALLPLPLPVRLELPAWAWEWAWAWLLSRAACPGGGAAFIPSSGQMSRCVVNHGSMQLAQNLWPQCRARTF